MAEIDKMDRHSAIELAKRMRNKARNIELDRSRMLTRLGTTAVSMVGAVGMGYYMGGLQKEWEDAGQPEEEDPRKVIGVDLDLLIGLGVTAAGVMMAGPKKTQKTGEYVEALGTGILSGYAYSKGSSMGYDAAAEAA